MDFGKSSESGEGISLLVPFRDDDGTRTKLWDWLRPYWEYQLPAAEIIMGTDDGTPFSKSVAVNRAVSESSGKYLVILDADVLVPGRRILDAVKMIKSRPDVRTWYIPFNRLYRMKEDWTDRLLAQSPLDFQLELPLDGHWEDIFDRAPGLLHVFPREAYECVNGMDERFRGWGGEDTSFKMSMEVLWGKARRLNEPLIHLYHDRPGKGSSETRTWVGQTSRNRHLSHQYAAARTVAAMRKLVDSR